LGVVLPKNVLMNLELDDGDMRYLTNCPQGAYQLSRFDPDFERKITQAESIMERYKNTLRVLAK